MSKFYPLKRHLGVIDRNTKKCSSKKECILCKCISVKSLRNISKSAPQMEKIRSHRHLFFLHGYARREKLNSFSSKGEKGLALSEFFGGQKWENIKQNNVANKKPTLGAQVMQHSIRHKMHSSSANSIKSTLHPRNRFGEPTSGPRPPWTLVGCLPSGRRGQRGRGEGGLAYPYCIACNAGDPGETHIFLGETNTMNIPGKQARVYTQLRRGILFDFSNKDKHAQTCIFIQKQCSSMHPRSTANYRITSLFQLSKEFREQLSLVVRSTNSLETEDMIEGKKSIC